MSNPRLNQAEKQAAQLPGMFRRYGAELQHALRSSLSHQNLHVYDMLRYYMGWVDVEGRPCAATQGKMLRPTLCLFACEAAGGSVQQAMPAAVALEYIHNFSLIHDDIQDNDRTRHHRETLWAVWGVPKALVAGNVLRVLADASIERLVSTGVATDQALAGMHVLTEAYLEMIEGQYLDISFEGSLDIGMQQYMSMISRKTGALIRCSLHLGAAVASRDDSTVAAFRECGRALGYAFQIRDDYLGVWGEEEATGKPVGADIRRKKNSFPLVYAMSRAQGQEKQQLVEIYQKPELDDEDVAQVLDVMDRLSTRQYAESLTQEHCDLALRALSGVELAPEIRREIDELVHFLMVREH